MVNHQEKKLPLGTVSDFKATHIWSSSGIQHRHTNDKEPIKKRQAHFLVDAKKLGLRTCVQRRT